MAVNLPRKICQKLIPESSDISIPRPLEAKKRKDGQTPNPWKEYRDAGAS